MLRPLGMLLAGSVALAGGAAGEPLPVRDQNPLIRGAYLPLPGPTAVAEGLSYAAGVQWSNTVNIERSASERLLVDEETVEIDLSADYRAGPWRARATVPLIDRSGGVLDGFIADWHRWLGLRAGARPLRPRNAYAIEYQRVGGGPLSAARATGLGDVAVEGGRQLIDGARGRLEGWAGLEAPTGSRARLTGDDAYDLAAWLAGELALGPRLAVSARAGGSRSGLNTGVPAVRAVRFGTLALSVRATPALEAVAQLDAHSAVARGPGLGFLGRAVTLTVGGRYRRASGGILEAGVVEDLEVGHSPDVSFHLGWRWPRLR